MRYYSITSTAYYDWGGKALYWFEVNEAGHAERELNIYPNGNVTSYDSSHPEDEYGGLNVMVVDGDEEWWESYAVSKEEFERQWANYVPVNRNSMYVRLHLESEDESKVVYRYGPNEDEMGQLHLDKETSEVVVLEPVPGSNAGAYFWRARRKVWEYWDNGRYPERDTFASG